VRRTQIRFIFYVKLFHSKPIKPEIYSHVVLLAAHHERWDSEGYPNRLEKEEIPESGRIVAIADTFDALTTVRPYKEAWSLDEAYSYLKENAGSRFDPKMVDVFIEIREKVESIKAHWDSLDDGGQLSVSWI